MNRDTGTALRRLRTELDRVNRWIADLRSAPLSEELQAAGDNTPLTEVADATQVAEDQEIRATLIDTLILRKGRLEWAIDRARKGRYGVCVHCGGTISAGRLAAVPEAERCLGCQAEIEAVRRLQGNRAFGWIEAEERLQERAAFD
jgi:RNA polymerase-binding transcription factor DksA